MAAATTTTTTGGRAQPGAPPSSSPPTPAATASGRRDATTITRQDPNRHHHFQQPRPSHPPPQGQCPPFLLLLLLRHATSSCLGRRRRRRSVVLTSVVALGAATAGWSLLLSMMNPPGLLLVQQEGGGGDGGGGTVVADTIGRSLDSSALSLSSSAWIVGRVSTSSFRTYDPTRSLLQLPSHKDESEGAHGVDEGAAEAATKDPNPPDMDSRKDERSSSYQQPPASACYGSTQSVLPYLTHPEGREVLQAWVNQQPKWRHQQQLLRQQLQQQQQQARQLQQQQANSSQQVVAVPAATTISDTAPMNKGELLRMLLRQAEAKRRLLFTMQIGGHDGKSNDPMYNALVRDNNSNNDPAATVTGTNAMSPSTNRTLAHWLPIVAEPVGPNFGRLLETYQDIHLQRTLPCQLPVRWAMSYGNESSSEASNRGGGAGVKTCPFYRFNNDASAPESCHDKPEWVKTQLGTISESNGKLRHALHWECIVVDHVPCGTMHDLLAHQWGAAAAQHALSNLMVLQVDVEGYEEVLLPAVFKEADRIGIRLPPVIHYESKILKYWDRRDTTTRLSTIRDALRHRGYRIYEDLEDDLAIHIDGVQ